jgi:hypothetical protein
MLCMIEPLRSLQKTMSQLGENQEILQKELDDQKSVTDKVIDHIHICTN